eukprot:3818013-Pleurochrysis_carterae.AAC.3
MASCRSLSGTSERPYLKVTRQPRASALGKMGGNRTRASRMHARSRDSVEIPSTQARAIAASLYTPITRTRGEGHVFARPFYKLLSHRKHSGLHGPALLKLNKCRRNPTETLVDQLHALAVLSTVRVEIGTCPDTLATDAASVHVASHRLSKVRGREVQSYGLRYIAGAVLYTNLGMQRRSNLGVQRRNNL